MTRTTQLLLLLIILWAATTRIIGLDDRSLWVDEGYAIYHANFPNLVQTLARDTHPPLYFAALRLWQELTGNSELALRWFSVLPSLLSIALIAQLGAEVIRWRGGQPHQSPVPLLAALFLALADTENHLAGEVRHYTWHVLQVIASMWTFLRWARTGRVRWRLWWLVITIITVYTHYIGALAGIVQGLWALLCLDGIRRRQAIFTLMLAALALSPWLALVGSQQIDNRGANWSLPVSFQDIRNIWFGGQWALMGGLFLWGLADLRASWRLAILLALWFFVPIALIYVGNEALPLLSPRRMTQITPVVALLIASGLAAFRPPARHFLIVVIVIYSALTTDFSGEDLPWRSVAQSVTRDALAGQLALTDIAGGDYHLQYYYRRYLPNGVAYRSLKEWRDFSPQTYEAGLPQLLADYNTVWLLHWNDDRSGIGWLELSGFSQTLARNIPQIHPNMNLFRYDRLPAGIIGEYENGLQLLDARITPTSLRADLIWRAARPLSADYTVSLKWLTAEGALAAQNDQMPPRPTSDWPPDSAHYDLHYAQTPNCAPLPAGEYTVVVEVYLWSQEGIQTIPTKEGQPWQIIATIALDAPTAPMGGCV